MFSNTINGRGISVIAVASILIGTSVPAVAQEGNAEPELSNDGVIVVTAQRREQALSDVPSAIQAFSGDDLLRKGVAEVRTAISLIPGASKSSEISNGTEAYQFRGVAAGQAIGDQTIGFYIDDFAYSLTGLPYAPSANFYDLNRIEVLRGPSGTLYGQGSFGGTIRVITNDPDLNEVEGSYLVSASLTEGGAPNGSANAMLNVPIIPGKLAVRGVLTYDRKGGWVDMPLIDVKNGNDSDVIYGRVKLLFEPTENLRISLNYARNRTDQGFTNRMDSIDPATANDTGNGITPLRYNYAIGQIDYDLGGVTATSITGQLRHRSKLTAFGFQPAFGFYDITTTTKSKSFSQEFRLSSNDDNVFDWVLGAYYRKGKTYQDQDFAVTVPGFQALDVTENSSESIAVYGEASLELLDGALIPTVGGRYFKERRELDTSSTFIVFNPMTTTGPAFTDTSRKSSAFSPRVNLAFHPSDDGLIYAEVSRGFRSGGIQSPNSVAALGLLGVSVDAALEPDTLWNYEIGTKWDLFNRALSFELAAYQYDWSDAQVQYSPAGLTAIIQVGDVRGRGIDLSLRYRTPIEGLNFQVVGNINEAELRNVPGAVTAGVPHLVNGSRLPGSPAKTLTFASDLNRPLGDTGYDLLANASYHYRGKQRDIVTGNDSASIDIVNARIGFGDDGFEVFLFADNILDDIGPAGIDSGRFVMPRPRTVGISVSGKF